jgi:ABC-2 type transport system permease protein
MTFRTNCIGFNTLFVNEMTRFLRIWIQTLLPPAITMTLYFTIFGYFIGSQIPAIQGYTYMQFIAPGLIMMSIITNSYTNVVSSLYGMRFQKSIEEILVSPLPNYLVLLGFISGGVARGIIVGILIAGIASLFTHIHIHDFTLVVTTAFLTAILFSLAGFLNGLFAKKFDDITIIPTFVLTPLTYLGGVFYSVTSLPTVWKNISLANPILHIVNSFRYGMLGISDINIHHSLSIISICILVLFSLCIYLLNKGVGIRT